MSYIHLKLKTILNCCFLQQKQILYIVLINYKVIFMNYNYVLYPKFLSMDYYCVVYLNVLIICLVMLLVTS